VAVVVSTIATRGLEEVSVPLSEHEQRLLEQMERALYAEDPKFATSLRGKDPRSNFRRRVLLASLGFLVGIVLLMTGLVAQVPLVSVLGFVAMLLSVFLAVTSYRAMGTAAHLGVVDGGAVRKPHSAPSKQRGRARAGGGLMGRLEERWNRRRDEDGR